MMPVANCFLQMDVQRRLWFQRPIVWGEWLGQVLGLAPHCRKVLRKKSCLGFGKWIYLHADRGMTPSLSMGKQLTGNL